MKIKCTAHLRFANSEGVCFAANTSTGDVYELGKEAFQLVTNIFEKECTKEEVRIVAQSIGVSSGELDSFLAFFLDEGLLRYDI